MARVILHGALAEYHAEPLQLAVASPAEAVRALLANFPGIGDVIRAGKWHVIRGPEDTGLSLDHTELTVGLGPDTEVHFIPAVEGSGRGGALKTIIGVVIMVVAVVAAVYTGGTSLALYGQFSVSYGAIFMFGASMALNGISQMLAPTPKMQSFEADKDRSYIMAGPTNRMEQGGPVPVIYGRCRVGSVVIAASITNDDIAAEGAYLTVSPSDIAVESAAPVDIDVSSGVSTTCGFQVSNITGGTLKQVKAGVETDIPADGRIIELFRQTAKLRFIPAWTEPVLAGGGNGDGASAPVLTHTYAGGGFKVQALVGLNFTPSGRTAAVSVHVPVPNTGEEHPGGSENGPV